MWTRNIVILLSLQLCFAFDLPMCKTELNINNDHYNATETYQIGKDAVPTDAHYDSFGNLFYVESSRTDEGYRFDINVLKPKSNSPEKVPGLPDGVSYSIAVDTRQTKIYFGTGQGMYTYNYDSHSALPVANITLKLDTIFIDTNSTKYIIENEDGVKECYLLDGDKETRCQSLEAFNEMAIDNENNFYFIREGKLYVLKSRQDTPICIGNVTYGGNAQISFYRSNVFVASDKLAYFHENDTGNLKLVDNVPGNVTAIAFDHRGEFVLGIQGKIIKYKKNECYFPKSRVIDEYSTALYH